MGKCVPHPVHTSCLTCSLPSCSVTQHCPKKGFLSWSHSSLLSLLFLCGFSSFLVRTSFLVSSYVLFWSSFPSPSVISFNLCAAAAQCLNFTHFILHPISHFYSSLALLLPLSPPQLSSGSSRFLAPFFFFSSYPLSVFKNLIGMLSSSCLRKPFFFLSLFSVSFLNCSHTSSAFLTAESQQLCSSRASEKKMLMGFFIEYSKRL